MKGGRCTLPDVCAARFFIFMSVYLLQVFFSCLEVLSDNVVQTRQRGGKATAIGRSRVTEAGEYVPKTP